MTPVTLLKSPKPVVEFRRPSMSEVLRQCDQMILSEPVVETDPVITNTLDALDVKACAYGREPLNNDEISALLDLVDVIALAKIRIEGVLTKLLVVNQDENGATIFSVAV
jgi:hypothetical protein